jgi:hypothetical protein
MGGEYGQDWPKLRLLLGIETSAGQAVASDRPTSPHGGGIAAAKKEHLVDGERD